MIVTAHPSRFLPRAPWALVALGLTLAAGPARAQGGALAQVRLALEALGQGPCVQTAPAGVWEVRVAVVVFPDGGWSVALGPFGALGPVSDAAESAMRVCAHRALAQTLAPRLPGPPRAITALHRPWRIATAAQNALRARLDASRADVLACLAGAPELDGAADISLWVSAGANARPVVTPVHDTPLGRRVSRCVARAVVALPPVEAPVEWVIHVEPPPPPASAPDGRLGAICRWGEYRRGEGRMPAPRPCRPGLQCCSAGGAAGSDSVCMSASQRCPMYP